MPAANHSIVDYNDIMNMLQVIYDSYNTEGIVLFAGDFNGQLVLTGIIMLELCRTHVAG